MGIPRMLLAALAAFALIGAACAAEEPEPTPFDGLDSPGISTPEPTEAEPTGDGFGESPGTGIGESPGTGLGESPGTGVGESPGTGVIESPGMSPGESPAGSPGATDDPGLFSPSPSPDDGEMGVLTGEALGVVDVNGTRLALEGQCELSGPAAARDEPGVPGQPVEGSTLLLTLGAGAPGTPTDSPSPSPDASPDASPGESPAVSPDVVVEPGEPEAAVQLMIELRRETEPGPANPSPTASPAESPAESPSPAGASPSPTGEPGEPVLTTEDVLPFTLFDETVSGFVSVPDQDLGQPVLITGTVAPNGLSGYVASITDQGQALTVNFVCQQSADGVGEPTESPSPGLESPSPAIESPGASPSP